MNNSLKFRFPKLTIIFLLVINCSYAQSPFIRLIFGNDTLNISICKNGNSSYRFKVVSKSNYLEPTEPEIFDENTSVQQFKDILHKLIIDNSNTLWHYDTSLFDEAKHNTYKIQVEDLYNNWKKIIDSTAKKGENPDDDP